MYDINVQKQKRWFAFFLGLTLTTTTAYARRVTVTEYCLKCSKCDTVGITATGTKTKKGLAVSTDPSKRAYPLGTLVEVDGEILLVDDTGGKVGRGQLDRRGKYHSHKENLKAGRKIRNVKKVGYKTKAKKKRRRK